MRVLLVLCVFVQCTRCFFDMTIAEYLSRHNFTSFLHNTQHRTGTLGKLNQAGAYTVVAPVNEAFARLLSTPRGEYLMHTSIQMTLTLERLVLPGFCVTPTMRDGEHLMTIGGMSLVVNKTRNSLALDGMTVTGSDIILNNGVVQVVDDLTLPPNFDLPTIKEIIETNDHNFSTLRFLFFYFKMWSVFDTDAHHVLLVPTNEAFSTAERQLISVDDKSARTFYTDLLRNHIVSSEIQTLTNLHHGQALVNLNNEVIHVEVAQNLGRIYAEKPAINGVVIPTGKILFPSSGSKPALSMFG